MHVRSPPLSDPHRVRFRAMDRMSGSGLPGHDGSRPLGDLGAFNGLAFEAAHDAPVEKVNKFALRQTGVQPCSSGPIGSPLLAPRFHSR